MDITPQYKKLILQGVKNFQIGQYEKSIELFDESIKLKDDNDLVYYNRGLCYYEQKNYEKSLSDLKRAIYINPKHNPSYYYSKGLTLLQLHRYEDALMDFNRYLSYQEDSEGFCSKGLALAMLGRFEEAILNYDLSLKLDPSNESSEYNRKISLRQVVKRSNSQQQLAQQSEEKRAKSLSTFESAEHLSEGAEPVKQCDDLDYQRSPSDVSTNETLRRGSEIGEFLQLLTEQDIKPLVEPIFNETENLTRKSSFDDIFTFCYRGSIK